MCPTSLTLIKTRQVPHLHQHEESLCQRQEDTLARLGLGPGAQGRPLLSTAASCLLQCSKTCGGGHRRRALKCEDHNRQEIHEMYCANLIRPPDVESCNDHACEVVWITGEWTEVRASVNEPLPKGQKALPLPSGPFTLVVVPPLQCSASCGQGYRQRLISCSEVHVESENYQYGHQSLSNCPGTPPESYMPCHLDPCPSPQAWQVGLWGPVSEPLISTQRFWLRMG